MEVSSPVGGGVVVRELREGEERSALRVLVEAFADDPIWRAIGPRSPRLRRMTLVRMRQGALAKARRWGGPIIVAERDGVIEGVTILCESETWPPPRRAILYDLPALLLAGPRRALRARRIQATFTAARPREPHIYLWLHAVAPGTQHRGVGHAMMKEALAYAARRRTPILGETFTAENRDYFATFGEVTGEAVLPGGAPVWFLQKRF
jgi:GNAT superfamily N-acetyltransferase